MCSVFTDAQTFWYVHFQYHIMQFSLKSKKEMIKHYLPMDTYLHCPSEFTARVEFVLQKFALQRTQPYQSKISLPSTKAGSRRMRCAKGMWNA